MDHNAQGTIEYLVIIAIVVVISLVVVVLLLNQTSSVSETDQKTTNMAWKTKEVQVMDFIADAQGQGTIILASKLTEEMTLSSILIESVSNPSSKQMFFGSTQRISLTGIPACTGQSQKYNITINYISKDGLSKSISGVFYANCVTNALSLNSLSLTTSDATLVTNTSIATGLIILTNSSAVNTDSLDDFSDGTNSDNQLLVLDNEIKLETN